MAWGIRKLKQARFTEAEAEFAQAAALDAVSAEFKTELAWATAYNPQRPEDARRKLAERVIERRRRPTRAARWRATGTAT